MSAREDAERFAEYYPAVFQRFRRTTQKGEYTLSNESLGVLLHLSRSGPLTVTEACRHFDRSQAAMSEILSRLEHRGLLERMPDERDRRRTLVWLTDQGTQAISEASTILSEARLASALEHMSPEDRAYLLKGFAALLATPNRPQEPNQGTNS